MDERIRFEARLLEGEKMAPLCAEFGISTHVRSMPCKTQTSRMCSSSGSVFCGPGGGQMSMSGRARRSTVSLRRSAGKLLSCTSVRKAGSTAHISKWAFHQLTRIERSDDS